MKYLVISDTHGDISKASEIAEKYKNELKGIIHLGDMIKDAVNLKYRFKDLEVEYICGNNDYNSTVPYEKMLVIGGKKILLTHGHRQRVNYGLMSISYWALEKGADAVFFGHTHTPTCQYIDGLAIFNPGSISYPRGVDFVSYGMLEVTENGRLIISLFKCNEDGTEEKIAMM